MTAAIYSGSYGCEREVLDPRDPEAEPGSAAAWNKYVAEAEAEERAGATLQILQAPLFTSPTPDLPFALRPEVPDSIVLPVEVVQPPLAELMSVEQPAKVYTWSEISETVRTNSLQAQAALQALEDEYRKDCLAHGLPIDNNENIGLSSLNSQADDEDAIRALERIKLESSNWSHTKLVQKQAPQISMHTPDEKAIRQLVEIVAYHSTPEYRLRNQDLINQLTAPPTDDMNKQLVLSRQPEMELGYEQKTGDEFLAEKQREHEQHMAKVQFWEGLAAGAMNDLTKLNKWLADYPQYKQDCLNNQEARIRKNQELLKQKFAKEEQDERERRERIERERQAKLEAIRKAEEKKKMDAIKAKEEAEQQKREEAERKQREKVEAERKQQEAIRKEQKEAAARQEAILEKEKLAAVEKRQKEDAEKRQKEDAEKQRRSTEVQNRRSIDLSANSAQLEALIEGRSQQILSTMPYAHNSYDRVKQELRRLLAYRATYMNAMIRTVPADSQQAVASRPIILRRFENYAGLRLNMETVQLRSKLIKSYYNGRETSELKYALSKKVTQLVGTKTGYLQAAKDILGILNGVADTLKGNGVASIIAVDDFAIQRQPKEGTTAPAALFVMLYNFLKTILVKAITEGPEKPGVMKALAMLLNSIVGGRAKYWPPVALTSLVYMRFWEQSPSLFGALGLPSDLGYRDLDGTLESSTDVNRRAEVAAALWCHMGILRPSNLKREQVITIQDIHRVLESNLSVPSYLRDELHYINVRTIMTVAPWELRQHLGYQGILALDQNIRRFCSEDAGGKLKAFAALLLEQMDTLMKDGYTNQMRVYGCDEWKYWDVDEIKDTNQRRASVEPIHQEQVQVDVNVTNERIRKERIDEEKFRPSGGD
ncbi:hypothetical protein ABW20_dc0100107 [Dactylellina cionopaga]|nr:hypothetical protein ABW20_dc0100107 [Dactylellina cionopaga]